VQEDSQPLAAMLPPSVIDAQGSTPRDLLMSSRGLLSETMYAELRPVDATTCRAATTCHDEFDETIRTVSEPECTKRRIESAGTGSTRSVPDARPRQGFSKGSASLQSLVRRRSRRHGGSSGGGGGGGGSSLPLEVELSTRQVYPVASDFVKDVGAATFRMDDEPQTATPTSTLVYATSSSAQPSTSRADNNGVQDISSSASNVAAATSTATGNNATPTTAAGRFGNASVSLLRTNGVAKPGPSTSSSWNNPEQENDYVVDPVQGNAYYKGQFLGKVGAQKFLSIVRAVARPSDINAIRCEATRRLTVETSIRFCAAYSRQKHLSCSLGRTCRWRVLRVVRIVGIPFSAAWHSATWELSRMITSRSKLSTFSVRLDTVSRVSVLYDAL